VLDLRSPNDTRKPLQRLWTTEGERVGAQPWTVSVPHARVAPAQHPEAQGGSLLRTVRPEGGQPKQPTQRRPSRATVRGWRSYRSDVYASDAMQDLSRQSD
jgi:hypothetical protein